MTVKQGFVRLIVVGAVFGITVQAALAKGPPQKVTISGGDLSAEIEVTDDAGILEALGTMMLEDFDTRTPDAPEGFDDSWGDGYLITRFYEDPPGHFFPFDAVLYYPDPEGGRGYIQYLGIANGWSEYDGKWFRASAEGEAALTLVITGAQDEASAAPSGILSLFLNALAALAGAN
jgi:hypothetical protein